MNPKSTVEILKDLEHFLSSDREETDFVLHSHQKNAEALRDAITLIEQGEKDRAEEDIMGGKTPKLSYKPNPQEMIQIAINAIKRNEYSPYKLVYDKEKRIIIAINIEEENASLRKQLAEYKDLLEEQRSKYRIMLGAQQKEQR